MGAPGKSAVTLFPVDENPSVEAVVAAAGRESLPAILDSAGTDRPEGRYTLVSCNPVKVAAWSLQGADPFEGMRERLAGGHPQQCPAADLLDPGRFLGWIGYFAYEAGRFIERLPASTRLDVGLPAARFGLYTSAAVHDTVTGRWAVAVAESDPQAGQTLRRWRHLLKTARPVPVPAPAPREPLSNMTYPHYLRQVRAAREYIAAGDIFQVNFARRESFPVTEPACTTYLRLRRVNPAAYSAFLAWEDKAIMSASPELFLQLCGRRATSRPIKGTRPRAADAARDRSSAAELACSAKDRAELAMIVDLVRNDLGRVCEYGSVQVQEGTQAAAPYELESHPTVHHLVATVTGRLAQGRDAIDLVRACFPGGSITGAPKVRAMEIIDELEPTERSVYTGAIGIFGLDGSMTLNIAIRTLIAAGGWVHVYAGGGIVADSVPEDEYLETCAKALGLRRALGCCEPPDGT